MHSSQMTLWCPVALLRRSTQVAQEARGRSLRGGDAGCKVRCGGFREGERVGERLAREESCNARRFSCFLPLNERSAPSSISMAGSRTFASHVARSAKGAIRQPLPTRA